jgi:hypothetical protein
VCESSEVPAEHCRRGCRSSRGSWRTTAGRAGCHWWRQRA